MRFDIEATRLAAAVTQAKAWSGPGNISPVLAGLRLTATADSLTVCATDTERWYEQRLALEVGEAGDLVVDAERFAAIVSQMTGTVAVYSLAHRLRLMTDLAKAEVGALEAAQWPEVPAAPAGEPLDAPQWEDMLRRVIPAASLDDGRANLVGVHFRREGERQVLEATDGHRAHLAWRDVSGPDGIILGLADARRIAKILSTATEVRWAVVDGIFWLRCDGLTIGCRLIAGDFPEIKQVMPKRDAAKCVATVNTDELVAALKFVGQAHTDTKKGKGVRVEVRDGEVELSAHSEAGECRQVVPADMRGSSGTVGVAVSYLIDAAQACGDRVEIGLGDETAPVRVDPALDTVNATCVVMPMRL